MEGSNNLTKWRYTKRYGLQLPPTGYENLVVITANPIEEKIGYEYAIFKWRKDTNKFYCLFPINTELENWEQWTLITPPDGQ